MLGIKEVGKEDEKSTTIDNLEEIKAKERCRAINEFLVMVKKECANRGVEYMKYGITFSDLERIAKDMKGEQK